MAANFHFVLDEDVSHYVAGILRSRGYNADSAVELGRLRISDVQVLVQAAVHRQTVVTHNIKHFELLHEAWLTFRSVWSNAIGVPVDAVQSWPLHAGILILPQQDPDLNARILEEFDDRFTAIGGLLYRWRYSSGWQEERI